MNKNKLYKKALVLFLGGSAFGCASKTNDASWTVEEGIEIATKGDEIQDKMREHFISDGKPQNISGKTLEKFEEICKEEKESIVTDFFFEKICTDYIYDRLKKENNSIKKNHGSELGYNKNPVLSYEKKNFDKDTKFMTEELCVTLQRLYDKDPKEAERVLDSLFGFYVGVKNDFIKSQAKEKMAKAEQEEQRRLEEKKEMFRKKEEERKKEIKEIENYFEKEIRKIYSSISSLNCYSDIQPYQKVVATLEVLYNKYKEEKSILSKETQEGLEEKAALIMDALSEKVMSLIEKEIQKLQYIVGRLEYEVTYENLETVSNELGLTEGKINYISNLKLFDLQLYKNIISKAKNIISEKRSELDEKMAKEMSEPEEKKEGGVTAIRENNDGSEDDDSNSDHSEKDGAQNVGREVADFLRIPKDVCTVFNQAVYKPIAKRKDPNEEKLERVIGSKVYKEKGGKEFFKVYTDVGKLMGEKISEEEHPNCDIQ